MLGRESLREFIRRESEGQREFLRKENENQRKFIHEENENQREFIREETGGLREFLRKEHEEFRRAQEKRDEEMREFNREILLRNEKVYTRVLAELEEGRKQLRANTQAVLSVLDRLEGSGGAAI